MMKIISFPDYKEFINITKERGLNATNCFYLPKAIQKKIEKNKLYVIDIDCGILLLEDEKVFYRVFYYLQSGQIPAPLTLDKQAVIELPYQDKLSPEQERQVIQINSMGFKLGRQSSLMSLSAADVRLQIADSPQAMISYAQQEDIEEILELLQECFNPLYAFLPDNEELAQNIADQKVWIIREGDYLAAVLNSKYEKNTAVISHIAVDKAFRGKGYGKLMVETYHQAYRERVRTFQHWVDLDNPVALRLYTDFGYQFTSRKANEYIL